MAEKGKNKSNTEKDLRTALDLLNSMFETMNDAASGATYVDTDAGKLTSPEFRFTPVFVFSEEDIEFMRRMCAEHGYDLDDFIEMLDEAKEE